MKLFSVKGTLKTELFKTLAQFEKRAAILGVHPDELVAQFHHNDVTFPADEHDDQRCIVNTRKKLLLENDADVSRSFLSVIR